MKAKRFIALLLALAMMFALAACSSGSSSDTSTDSSDAVDTTTDDVSADDTAEASSSSQYLEELNLGTYNSNLFTSCFDPTSGYAGSVIGNGSLFMIYDSLFYLDPETGSSNSRILESWEFDDTYTQLTIKLKDNIYFSNGVQMTCSDILYSIDQMKLQTTRRENFERFDLESSRATISEDGLSMTLYLYEMTATFYDMACFAILCEEYVEDEMGGGENIDWYDPDQIVGSGPYEVTAYESGATITLEKRDDYWGLEYGYDDPYLKVNVTNYTDQSTMCIALESGEIDVAIDLAVTDYTRLAEIDDDNITTQLIPGNSNWVLTMDTTGSSEYLSDPVVRQAICEAIDTDAISEAVGGAFGSPADSILASGELGYVGGLAYDYDPDHARQLLEDAGYEDGEIVLSMLIMNSEPCPSIAVIVADYLAQIGITLTYEAYDNATYNSMINIEGSSDLCLTAMSGGNASGDPSTEMDWYLSTSNYAAMRKDYDDLIDFARSTMDTSAREETYAEIQQLFYDNYEAVPLYTLYKGYAYNNEIFEELNIISTLITWIFDCELN